LRERVADGLWDLYFGPVLPGTERELTIEDHRGRRTRRNVLTMFADVLLAMSPVAHRLPTRW